MASQKNPRPGQVRTSTGTCARYARIPDRPGRSPEKPSGRPAFSRNEAGHGRRHRGFVDEEQTVTGNWCLDPDKLPASGFSVQVAPHGFLEPLLEELKDRVITVNGRLVLAKGDRPAHWAQTVWLNPVWMPFTSIKDAANKLKAIQRNWRGHIPPSGGVSRRAALIETELPHMSCRPLTFGDTAPTAPLGAFTLWNANLMLAASHTTSPFPDGEVHFTENKIDPPGRAYLKLWESFTRFGIGPKPGELCVDLGASPGSWTWVLSEMGCRVFSIDKAPLADHISCRPNVNHCLGSGFGLEPGTVGKVDWLFSDMICYPARLLTLVKAWMAADAAQNMLCTLKFQAVTDFETLESFASIPGSRLIHLSCNRHELTWIWSKQEQSQPIPV